jgi:hypothetical protein
MSLKENELSKRSKSKIFIILPICLIVLIGGAYAWYSSNKPLFWAYYYDVKLNPFKYGDKMYLNDWLVDKTSAKEFSRYDISLYRLARPLNDDQVDAMSISLAEKALIKKDLSSKKPIMEDCGWSISTDSLCKYKSAYVSNYSGSKIANIYFGNNEYFPRLFFAVHPIRTALIRSESKEAPSGYAFDDNEPFYLEADQVKSNDSKSFREIK